jgi:hypothetical protein
MAIYALSKHHPHRALAAEGFDAMARNLCDGLAIAARLARDQHVTEAVRQCRWGCGVPLSRTGCLDVVGYLRDCDPDLSWVDAEIGERKAFRPPAALRYTRMGRRRTRPAVSYERAGLPNSSLAIANAVLIDISVAASL